MKSSNSRYKNSLLHTFMRISLLLVLFSLFLWARNVEYAYANVDDATTFVTVLVGFHSSTSDAEQIKVISELNGEILRHLDAIHVVEVNLPIPENMLGNANPAQRLQQISRSYPAVAFVEADGTVHGTGMPNDPDLSDSQKMYTPEVLDLESAWEITTGSPDIVIAVLDTGIAKEHPEFRDKFLPGYDFFNDDEDPSDDHGHGSHVSGIAAAAVNNGEGLAGICGQCTILPVKVLNENNAGIWSDVADGIIYAADQGAQVISLSLGSSSGSQTVQAAVDYAVEAGAIIVAAAGNSSSNNAFYPAAYDGVIAVAATDAHNERWSLSNYGSYIDISAPGSSVYSTFYDLNNAYGGYTFMSGTSMAAPHVSGLIGLLLSQDPTRTPEDIKSLLLNTAKDLGTAGWDEYFGYGRLDPVTALTADSSDPRTASISGFVWKDANGDAQPDPDEPERVADALIQIRRSNGATPIATVRSRSNGAWSITQLPAGTYVAAFVEDEEHQITGASDVTVELSTAEHEEGINFGVAATSDGGLAHKTYVPVIMVKGLSR